MTIYWQPVGSPDPDPTVKVDYYEVWQDGTKLGDPSEPSEFGMPDSLGGTAPDAVRAFVESETDKTAYKTDQRTEYIRGSPAQ